MQLEAAELRARRAGLGLTQADLATNLGVATNTVARWERGERSIGHPRLIRRAIEHLEDGMRSIACPLPLSTSFGQPTPVIGRDAEAGGHMSPDQIPEDAHVPPERLSPTARTLSPTTTNLPLPPTRLIGRELEITEIRWRLEDPNVRLVTLTGPGGSGKS